MKAPYTQFGQTRNVPVVVYQHGKQIESERWDETLWMECAEDWYALMSSALKGKRVRVIEAAAWRRAPASGADTRSNHCEPCSSGARPDELDPVQVENEPHVR